MFESYHNKIQSVSDVTRSIKGLLEIEFPFITVLGEISNLRRPYSGHIYFTLKDHTAQLKAVMFKPQQRYLALTPEDGREVICKGRISVYELRGEYQLIVDHIDFKGTGSLQAAFEELKNKLAEEGLFDESHKQPLPFLPERIALVTSPEGAAVHDFLKITNSRFAGVPIEIFPVRVQGDAATDEVVEALQIINERQTADVIVVCRGGGSIEDLWTFNEEKVARAIFNSAIPVVSAIGHEVDFTIADFVADYRAPTPSAAAEAVLPDKEILREKITALKKQLATAIILKLDDYHYLIDTYQRMLGDPTSLLDHFLLRLDHAQTCMVHALTSQLHFKKSNVERLTSRLFQQNPGQKLVHQKEYTKQLANQLKTMMALQLERKKAELQKNAALLDAVSPLAVLGRGYSIAKTIPAGKVIRDSSQVKKGTAVNVRLHKGEFDCEVTKTY